jgi:uncharacterized protein YbjT (DUF2867 family)
MRVFVAGATGATGRVFVPRALAAGHEVIFHVRPKSASKSPLGNSPLARVFDLGDPEALTRALAGCEAIVSFVGTESNRIGAGDTYESSDLASTRQLVEGARTANVPRLLLQSSVGAGGPGAYLRTKAACEAIVRRSGLRWTVWRPSGLVSPAGSADEPDARRAPFGSTALFAFISTVPGLRGFADDYRPIPINVVCDAVLGVLAQPRDCATLSGRDLWALARPSAHRRPSPGAANVSER